MDELIDGNRERRSDFLVDALPARHLKSLN